MSKQFAFPGLSEFVAATARRNMTRAAYVAVACGVGMMVLLTVDGAYEAAHQYVDAGQDLIGLGGDGGGGVGIYGVAGDKVHGCT